MSDWLSGETGELDAMASNLKQMLLASHGAGGDVF